MAKEIMTRRSLPHWYMPGAAHFVTYRLADSLPQVVRDRLNEKRDSLLKRGPGKRQSIADHRLQIHKQLFSKYDNYLDQSSDIDWLRNAQVATVVRSNLYHHHGNKYHLMSYCIMPNHVHVLLLPKTTVVHAASVPDHTTAIGEQDDSVSPLTKIMHSLKSYTANKANTILGRAGRFWQKESYDHWVRDDDELERIVNYIRGNPVKAGLCTRHEDWPWCSCHDRFLHDGDTSGWLVGN